MSPVKAEDESVPQSIKKASFFRRWKQNPRAWFSPAWFYDWKLAISDCYNIFNYTKREGAIHVFSSLCSESKYVIAGVCYWLNSVGVFAWGKAVALKVAGWVTSAVVTASVILKEAV